MNTKLKKSLNIAAAAIFIFGLGINIQMSLDDPFENVNAIVLAEDTTGSGGGACLDSFHFDAYSQRSISGAETCRLADGSSCGNQEICETSTKESSSCTEHTCKATTGTAN